MTSEHVHDPLLGCHAVQKGTTRADRFSAVIVSSGTSGRLERQLQFAAADADNGQDAAYPGQPTSEGPSLTMNTLARLANLRMAGASEEAPAPFAWLPTVARAPLAKRERGRSTFALRATVDNLRMITGERRLVDLTGGGWNHVVDWLRQVEGLQRTC